MPVNDFIDVFREEHRQLRDMLLGLIDAFESSDSERVRQGIEQMTAHAAPHFQYEQEALYPALADVHGESYVEKLIEEHEQALEAAWQLAELAEQEELDEATAEYGLELVRQLLPHVSDRDGLAVMVEVLEPEAVEKLHKAQKESKKGRVSLAGLTGRTKKSAAKGKKDSRVTAKNRKAPTVPKQSAKASRARTPKAPKRRPPKGDKRGR
jgi:Hemerythrin HHE cation binding domain